MGIFNRRRRSYEDSPTTPRRPLAAAQKGSPARAAHPRSGLPHLPQRQRRPHTTLRLPGRLDLGARGLFEKMGHPEGAARGLLETVRRVPDALFRRGGRGPGRGLSWSGVAF